MTQKILFHCSWFSHIVSKVSIDLNLFLQLSYCSYYYCNLLILFIIWYIVILLNYAILYFFFLKLMMTLPKLSMRVWHIVQLKCISGNVIDLLCFTYLYNLKKDSSTDSQHYIIMSMWQMKWNSIFLQVETFRDGWYGLLYFILLLQI